MQNYLYIFSQFTLIYGLIWKYSHNTFSDKPAMGMSGEGVLCPLKHVFWVLSLVMEVLRLKWKKIEFESEAANYFQEFIGVCQKKGDFLFSGGFWVILRWKIRVFGFIITLYICNFLASLRLLQAENNITDLVIYELRSWMVKGFPGEKRRQTSVFMKSYSYAPFCNPWNLYIFAFEDV